MQLMPSGSVPDLWRRLHQTIPLRHLYAAILFGGTLAVCVAVFDENPDLNGDNTNYLMLGRALATGQGYTNTDFITPVPATSFPPGYPVLVALLVTLFPDEMATVKMANGVFFALSILLLFHLFSRLGGNCHLAFVACVGTVLNTHLLRSSTIMMSEIPFLLFTTATIVLFLHTLSATRSQRLKTPQLYLFLLCLVFSCYIRTAGLSLLIGVLLVLLLRRDWRYMLLIAGVFVLAMLPWSLRNQQLGGNAYASQFLQVNPYKPELGLVSMGDLASRLFENASRYVSHEIPHGCLSFISRDYIGAIRAGVVEYSTGAVLIAVMLFGLYHINRDRDVVAGYLLGTFAILLGWPEVWKGVRFLIPVVPLLLFCLFHGLWMVIQWLRRHLRPSLPLHPLMLLLLILPSVGKVYDLHQQADAPMNPNWHSYFEMARWVGENLPEDVVVCCRKPSLFHLYAQRPVTRYEFFPDTDEFIDHLERLQVPHVVMDPLRFNSTTYYLYPAVRDNLEMFRMIHKIEDPDTFLLEFRHDAKW